MGAISNDVVLRARKLALSNNFIGALQMYMCAIAKQPKCRRRLMNEFLVVLSNINEELAAEYRISSIFANLKKANDVFPMNVKLLNDTGNYLFRYGYMIDALRHFEKALQVNNSCITIEKSLNTTKIILFPRNEFRALNDRKRNNAFRAAINATVKQKDNVIHIQAGTGLLSLYASECGAKWIDAYESSSTMAQLAELVRRDNRAHNVIINNMSSVALQYNAVSSRRSVLMTDAIDSGLFGENILQGLYHAWSNLLYNYSKIIPCKAEYFVVAVKCDELYNKYHLSKEIKKVLNVTYMNVLPSTLRGETYCSEDIHLYKNLKYMSEPKSLFTIDFNSFQDVYEKLHNPEPYNAEIIPTKDGEINTLIGWFNLHLTEDITLTSDPRWNCRAAAYQQAVFFDFLPKKVRRKETVNVPFTTYGGRLSTMRDFNTTVTRISLETIAYMNDMEFTNMVTKSIGAVCMHLGQRVEMEQVDVLDLSPFPLFGILMLRRGANSLVCLAKTLDDEGFLQTVLVANRIPRKKVTILVSEYWSMDVLKNKKFHVIFGQILDLNGDVNVKRQSIIQRLKKSHLMPGGICLPSSVTVMGQLISSSYLDTNNRVLDENVDCQMSKNVNRYQVTQIMHLDIARLEYERLSDAFEMGSCNDLRPNVTKVTVVKDGDCNAILCWYKIQMMANWYEINTKRSNSFVQSMAFMTKPECVNMLKGDKVNVRRCIDPTDGSFKLALDMKLN